jgi:CheY-like chemotaxis protein/two-component sensor histidine kinase
MLAHELRNPLAPIRSAADLLAAAKLEGALAKVPEVISRQVDHMKRVVDDLLDVSRIARGRVSLAMETLDLVELVRATATDHAASFASANLVLSVELGEGPLWIRGDATRMAQAVANLLHNALKFTPKGRSVSVKLHREDLSDSMGARAVLEVSDEGVGIPPELLGRLFEPFSQGDRTLARSKGGLGLGLAIVQGLVALHGGDVSAFSEGEGKGAKFRVTVPLAPAPRVAAEPASVEHASRAHNVLIVEDNPDAADMLALLVKALGHEVRIARSAADALAILEQWRAHVILSDLGLPDVTGFELAERVQSQTGPRAPLLVAVSGYGSPDDKARTRAAGFHHHVTKPIDRSTLKALLESA